MNLLKKDILEKIETRNKLVREYGMQKNFVHDKYLKAGVAYDNLKAGFYTALELSQIDKDINENDLQRFKCSVKSFDHELLKQMKERDYKVQCNPIEEGQKNAFTNRIQKLQEAGLIRNKLYIEFLKEKENFDVTIRGFYKELTLALKDGVITEIEKNIYEEPIQQFDFDLNKELQQQRHAIMSDRNACRNKNQKRSSGEPDKPHGRFRNTREFVAKTRGGLSNIQSRRVSRGRMSYNSTYTGRFVNSRYNNGQFNYGRLNNGRYYNGRFNNGQY